MPQLETEPKPLTPAPPARVRALTRLGVRGKFFYDGRRKFYGRGVTYGPFRPTAEGSEYRDPASVEKDFGQMAAQGVNCVRLYTVPPRWLLDLAQEHGLRVLISLPWEQHIAFLDDPARVRDVENRIRRAVRQCGRHPAIFGWAIGNEIPAPLVRWFGHRKVERFLERLYWAVKGEDPEGLVTYVSYPSTEYLELPFADFVSFNVYLESEATLDAYVARLQNLAGERPLVMGEIGLDSRRNGLALQGQTLESQLRLLFAAGCASAFVFAWTDEWHRGGCDIEDWDFGLTTRERAPKPALAAVRRAFQAVPFPRMGDDLFISVVICSYNGARTLAEALSALQRLEYASFEIVVVDDGSSDATPAIAERFGVRLIRQSNLGLSAARNAGWRAARGEIVAYLDDDAAPDPHWLRYLAHGFRTTEFAAIAGPNIAFPDDGWVAHAVDHAPGNPTHVLIADREAEHLPGCNMAFRRDCLVAVGGFDPQFRIAGDDVDLCWRIQQRGWRLGYHAGAMVWHHRRGTIRSYWRQQFNYGRAEGMLERKWPRKYNSVGHLGWNGRIYDKSFCRFLQATRRIYHGSWGSALFQRVYHPSPWRGSMWLTAPEWYPLAGAAAVLVTSGVLFRVGYATVAGIWLGVFLLPTAHAWRAGRRAFFSASLRARHSLWRLRLLTAFLHWLQPVARAMGRLRQGLTPWRWRAPAGIAAPIAHGIELWNQGAWRDAEQRLTALESDLEQRNIVVTRGSEWDRWDLEVRGGVVGHARVGVVIEEHGSSRQLIRFRISPRFAAQAWLGATALTLLLGWSLHERQWLAASVLAAALVLLLGRSSLETGAAIAVSLRAIVDTVPPGEVVLGGEKRRPRYQP